MSDWRDIVRLRAAGRCERCGRNIVNVPAWPRSGKMRVAARCYQHPTASRTPNASRRPDVAQRTCSHSDCQRKHYSLGYCLAHYRRHKSGRDMDAPILEKSAPIPTCIVNGCANLARSKTTLVCEMHYYRMRRTGTYDIIPKPAPKPKVKSVGKNGKVPKSWRLSITAICAARDCGELAKSKGYCGKHWERVRRFGCYHVVHRANWTGADATYTAVHQRLRKKYGSASEHKCMCGEQARHWAYLHNDPNERQDASGPYSIDPANYLPMCVGCHKRFDLGLA